MATETECAACEGTGEVICHLNTADPVQRGFSWIKCSTCAGSGRVSSDLAARLAAGDRLRTLRVDELDLSLREGAARINVTPEQLSGFENGRYGIEEIACAERWMRAGGDPDVIPYPMIDLGIVSVTPPRGDGWSVRFRCGCHVYLYGREWLIWSLGRHALGRRCDAHSSRVRALGDTSVVHGQSCAKAPHTGDGYLHGAGDDAPYTVDGAEYCGRCHVAMGGMEVGRG